MSGRPATGTGADRPTIESDVDGSTVRRAATPGLPMSSGGPRVGATDRSTWPPPPGPAANLHFRAPTVQAPTMQNPSPQSPPTYRPAPNHGTETSDKLPMLLGAVAAVVVVALGLGAFLVLSGSHDESAARPIALTMNTTTSTSTTTTTTSTTTTTTAPPPPPVPSYVEIRPTTPPVRTTTPPTTEPPPVVEQLPFGQAAAAVDAYLAGAFSRDENVFAALWSYPIQSHYGNVGVGEAELRQKSNNYWASYTGITFERAGETELEPVDGGWSTSTNYFFDMRKVDGTQKCGLHRLTLVYDHNWLVTRASESPVRESC